MAKFNRIEWLDSVRGFAVCGILLVNIAGFGYSADTPKLYLSAAGEALFLGTEGTMRALFCLLFGLGFQQMIVSKLTVGAYMRRLCGLALLGLFNMYALAWPGDILFTYALCGLILILLRNTGSFTKIYIAIFGTVLIGVLARLLILAVTEASSPDFLQEEMGYDHSLRYGTYWANILWSAQFWPWANSIVIVFDSIFLMILGGGLYQYLSVATKATNQQLVLSGTIFAFIGLSIKLTQNYAFPLTDYGLDGQYIYSQFSYDLGRTTLGLGYAMIIIYLSRNFCVGRLLAPIGRMALSNYLIQSFVCLFIFAGFGLGLYDQLTGLQIIGVALSILSLQLVYSNLWLRWVPFGPFEYLLRAFTHLSWRPKRKVQEAQEPDVSE